MKHTSATLFVDNFVTGRVPDVCAVSGVPTTDRLVLSTEIDGPSPGWLFLLLFPILGWFILALVMVSSRRSYLRGELPISEDAYRRRRRESRIWSATLVAGIALVLTSGFVLGGLAQLGSVGVVVGLAVALVAGIGMIRSSTGTPRIALDGSRRWVTINRVHPAFAAAVEAADDRAGVAG